MPLELHAFPTTVTLADLGRIDNPPPWEDVQETVSRFSRSFVAPKGHEVLLDVRSHADKKSYLLSIFISSTEGPSHVMVSGVLAERVVNFFKASLRVRP